MNRTSLLVSTPFDDPTATIAFGTAGGSPNAFIGPADVDLTRAGQYDADPLVTVGPDMLKLTISPGASTQGECLLVYKLIP